MEAKELARHADIRQTAKYTHIGMEDRAEALGNLPSPKVSSNVDRPHYVCISGGVGSHEVSPAVSQSESGEWPMNEQSPAGAGLASSSDVTCHQKAGYSEVEAAGIAPASRDPSAWASTCVAVRLIVGLGAPIGRIPVSLACYEFNVGLNKRFDQREPELASPAGPLGPKPRHRAVTAC